MKEKKRMQTEDFESADNIQKTISTIILLIFFCTIIYFINFFN